MLKKTIYISTGSMQAGGTERVISILTHQFVLRGFHIKILIWRSMPVFYKIHDSIEVIDIPNRCGNSNMFKCILYFRKYLKQNPPNLLLGFSAPFNMVSLISAIGLNIKTVVCERNDPRFLPFHGYQRLLRNLTYYLADGILTQTNHNKEYFPKRLKEKTQVIYNPIFMDKSHLGSALNKHNQHLIISVARLKKQKNQQLLIGAFARFNSVHSEYELYIYGEGDQRTYLEKLIAKFNLDDKIHLPGVNDRIYDVLQKAEMFVLPSNFEGMPNTLIEAMCIGLPCISTKVSGATDLIRNGENGLLVDTGNEDQIYHAMLYFAENPVERHRMGVKASELYNILSVDSISREWIAYLNEHFK